MLRIADLKYRTKLMLIAGSAVLGIIAVAALSFVTLNQVRIGSDLYERVLVNKDFASDLTPATLSVNRNIRPYLLSIEDNPNPAMTQATLEKVKEAQQEFEKSHDRYKTAVHSPKLKELLDGKLYTAAEQYFQILNGEYVPLVSAGKIEAAKTLRHQ